jgi:hypothetical protein
MASIADLFAPPKKSESFELPKNPEPQPKKPEAFSVSGTADNLVGPISGKYCIYFYILSLLAIIFFIVVIGAIIYTGYVKKMGAMFYVLAILYSCQFLLAYLQNRLLYNMCVNSI